MSEMTQNLNWGAIELFAMDVDGVLTDGSLYVSSDGSETKRFSIIDGLGLVMLREAGVKIAWISGRGSEATDRRAEELKVDFVIQGRKDKAEALLTLLEKLDLKPEQVAYMGDDTIDTGAIQLNPNPSPLRITRPSGLEERVPCAKYATISSPRVLN